MTIPPFDIVGDIPLLFELGGYGDGLVIQRLHSRCWFALEDDVALAGIMAVADDHGPRFLVGPVGFDLVVEIGGDDVLLADLAAGVDVGLKPFPDRIRIGEDVVRFGQTPSGHGYTSEQIVIDDERDRGDRRGYAEIDARQRLQRGVIDMVGRGRARGDVGRGD